MSDQDTPAFGKARPARHSDLSAQLGGLVQRTARGDDAPAATPDQKSSESAGETPLVAPAEKTIAPQPDPPATETAPAAAPRPRQNRPASPRQPSTATAPTASGRADRAVPVNLPLTLLERLERYRQNTGGSNPSIIFTAIESTYDRLADLIADRTVHLSGASDTAPSLFARTQPAVRHEPGQGPRKQLTIRITEQNKRILEDLRVQLGAPNRSVLVETALDTFLP